MKLLLAAAALALLTVSAQAGAPRGTCYTKTTNCCFTFSTCASVTKKTPRTFDCSFNQCKPVCRVVCTPSCRLVKTRVPKVVCKVHPGSCKHVWTRWGWKKQCSRPRKVCGTVFATVVKKVCTKTCANKCVTKCHRIKATCTSVTTTVFPKFCPRLSCSAPVIAGSSATPAAVVGGTAISTSVSKPVRTIIGKH